MHLSAVTFNIQNGQIWDEKNPDGAPTELNRCADFLLSLDADFLFLQEVERGREGGQQEEPPPNFTFLRRVLEGYDAAFSYPEKNEDELPFGIGIAIFSKFPLRNIASHTLPPIGPEFEFGGRRRKPSPRVLIEATCDLAGRPVHLFNTHLQACFMIGCRSDEWMGQRDAVERLLRARGGPALLGGDFNCAPDEGLLGQFGAAGFFPVQEAIPTWKRRPYVVDHIFLDRHWTLLEGEVIETDVSDHHAVRARIATSWEPGR